MFLLWNQTILQQATVCGPTLTHVIAPSNNISKRMPSDYSERHAADTQQAATAELDLMLGAGLKLQPDIFHTRSYQQGL